MAYVRFCKLPGTLTNVNVINEAYKKETYNTENIFDPDNEAWKSWVEYVGDNTYILAELSNKHEIEMYEWAYGIYGGKEA